MSMILLEVMRGTTAHTGVEPCVGPKTVVMSFPRVVVIGLKLVEVHFFGWTLSPFLDVGNFIEYYSILFYSVDRLVGV